MERGEVKGLDEAEREAMADHRREGVAASGLVIGATALLFNRSQFSVIVNLSDNLRLVTSFNPQSSADGFLPKEKKYFHRTELQDTSGRTVATLQKDKVHLVRTHRSVTPTFRFQHDGIDYEVSYTLKHEKGRFQVSQTRLSRKLIIAESWWGPAAPAAPTTPAGAEPPTKVVTPPPTEAVVVPPPVPSPLVILHTPDPDLFIVVEVPVDQLAGNSIIPAEELFSKPPNEQVGVPLDSVFKATAKRADGSDLPSQILVAPSHDGGHWEITGRVTVDGAEREICYLFLAREGQMIPFTPAAAQVPAPAAELSLAAKGVEPVKAPKAATVAEPIPPAAPPAEVPAPVVKAPIVPPATVVSPSLQDRTRKVVARLADLSRSLSIPEYFSSVLKSLQENDTKKQLTREQQVEALEFWCDAVEWLNKQGILDHDALYKLDQAVSATGPDSISFSQTRKIFDLLDKIIASKDTAKPNAEAIFSALGKFLSGDDKSVLLSNLKRANESTIQSLMDRMLFGEPTKVTGAILDTVGSLLDDWLTDETGSTVAEPGYFIAEAYRSVRFILLSPDSARLALQALGAEGNGYSAVMTIATDSSASVVDRLMAIGLIGDFNLQTTWDALFRVSDVFARTDVRGKIVSFMKNETIRGFGAGLGVGLPVGALFGASTIIAFKIFETVVGIEVPDSLEEGAAVASGIPANVATDAIVASASRMTKRAIPSSAFSVANSVKWGVNGLAPAIAAYQLTKDGLEGVGVDTEAHPVATAAAGIGTGVVATHGWTALLAAAPAESGVAAFAGGPGTAVAAVSLAVLPDLMAEGYARQYRNKSVVMGNVGIAGQLLGRSLGRGPLDYDQLRDLAIDWLQKEGYFTQRFGMTGGQFELELMGYLGCYAECVSTYNKAHKFLRQGQITEADLDLWFEQKLIPYMQEVCRGDPFKTDFVFGLFSLTLSSRLSPQNIIAIGGFVDPEGMAAHLRSARLAAVGV